MGLYFEAHVTIEPVFDERLEEFKRVARAYGFVVADLFIQKKRLDTPERSNKDTFCTGRSKNLESILSDTKCLVADLKELNLEVWRWKIEDILVDVRLKDK